MAKSHGTKNGRLEHAIETMLFAQASAQQTIAALQQNLTSMQQTQTSFLAQMVEMKVESDRRFARIEAILLEHTHILHEHSRMLAALPEAVRENIGFRGQGQPA